MRFPADALTPRRLLSVCLAAWLAGWHAGSADAAVIPSGIGGFIACKALSKRNDDPATASRPWDRERDGFVMGEGAGKWAVEPLAARESVAGSHLIWKPAGLAFAHLNPARTLSAPRPSRFACPFHAPCEMIVEVCGGCDPGSSGICPRACQASAH